MRKRIFALIMALVMIFAMTSVAVADATIGASGEQGAFESPDTPVSQSKTLNLEKELIAYNLETRAINAPTITYKYTIEAADVTGLTITDSNATTVHASGQSVQAPVKAGITTGITNPTVSWTCADSLNAGTDGVSNKKDLAIDFSNVVFTGAGVYRYKITESLNAATDTYAASGVTETTGNHVRYIDVYVRTASGYTDGTKATDWDIYGYTCFLNNESITDGNKTTNAVKTTGFVSGTTGGTNPTAFVADKYYTYNLEISKTVEGDAYGAANVAFPFTVIFTNGTITKNVDIIGVPSSDDFVGGYTDPAEAALSAETTKGVVTIKSGNSIKYVGIPNGTSVEVYETNIASGVTYQVTTSVTGVDDPVVENGITWGTAPTTAVAQAAEKPAYQSTKATITTTADADDDNAYTIAVTNKFEAISPTGVILRYAPYMLILVGGALLLFFGWKLLRRTRKEEEVA